jgi:hypothetical protein
MRDLDKELELLERVGLADGSDSEARAASTKEAYAATNEASTAPAKALGVFPERGLLDLCAAL